MFLSSYNDDFLTHGVCLSEAIPDIYITLTYVYVWLSLMYRNQNQNQKQIYCQEGFYTNKELVLLEKLNTFKTINKQLTNKTSQNNALQHTMAAVRGAILKPAVLGITCFNWQLNPVCCLKPLSHM